MFTVTLDTLIYRFYPYQAVRRLITNRKKGADVPDVIDEMGVHEAMVWLPIWNAHEQFWKDRGRQGAELLFASRERARCLRASVQ